MEKAKILTLDEQVAEIRTEFREEAARYCASPDAQSREVIMDSINYLLDQYNIVRMYQETPQTE